MWSNYRVKTVVLSSGERLPVLLDRDGQPMFAPTVFALTEVRGKNLAANTIGMVLRSVMTFHLYLDARGIDFEGRMASGDLLSLGEVEDLARLCRRPLAELAALSRPSEGSDANVVSLEKVRMGVPKALTADLDPNVVASRLRYIRMYIQWLATERLSRHGLAQSVASRLGDSTRFVADAIDTRIPHGSGRNTLGQREGVADEVVAELLRVVDPHSPNNPWRDQHTRYRNALLIHWLLYLGLRIGEALGVRVSDIVAYRKEVTIHRRADDPDDPRRYQPQTKTRARVLPVSGTLLAETQAYILNHRSALPQAKKHAFLFVASRTGQPMTLAAVGKLFKELRERCPLLPEGLSGHVLRHTWNDAFSKKMDEAGVTPENERQARSYLMGWSPTSDTAAVYTRRYVRNKAKEVSLGLQEQLVNKGKGNE
ncbi:MAG TPA: tyrosine-type recombinase/integrase [Nitrospira sp.]|nr:tyrosine-type recombinase/integrase [Nitrospira sp.]HNG03252.1 tyrosine-type recombinase/integrase [Nitrospira sp.]HNM19609.1 tyrosine-type recombinase/integrase [Nitrospira sp.]